MENLECDLYINSALSRDDLKTRLVDFVSGAEQPLGYFRCDWGRFYLTKNSNVGEADSSAGSFLFYRHLLEVHPRETVDRQSYVRGLSALMQRVEASVTAVVAACDFEDELPGHGRL